MDITDKILNALTALGDNEEEVAEALAILQVKGVPGDAESCPVANYLHKVIPGYDFSVFSTAAYKSVNSGLWSDTGLMVPDPVLKFICHFDELKYRGLVDDGQ